MFKFCLLTPLILFIFVQTAQAEDVYNFYFKKSKEATETQEEKIEYEDERGKENAQVIKEMKEKHTESREKERAARLTARKKRQDRESEDEDSWSVRLGYGRQKIDANFSSDKYIQESFIIGGSYHISDSFALNAEVQLPEGLAENHIAGASPLMVEWEPQFLASLSYTPIDFNLSRKSEISLGVDAGVIYGNSEIFLEDNQPFFLGFHSSLSFNRNWSVLYNLRRSINTDQLRFDVNSVALAYRW
jgi:hypothetical protein